MFIRLFTNIRLKFAKYIRENAFKIIIILVLILFFTSIYNMIVNFSVPIRPIVSKDIETPVISEEKFPKKVQEEGVKQINQFLEYVNQDKIDLAADMLTDEAKQYAFLNKKEAIRIYNRSI